MIGCFVDPFPDELLYSAFARFSNRVQFPNKKSILQELFGTTTCTATVELPSHLTKLISALPPGHHYTANRLIDGHTLLPLYSHFLPRERVTQLREGMIGMDGHILHRRVGLMASRIPTPQRFRFCPICVVKDRENVGETYWHRLHQLPGILVCPRHNVFLEDSQVRRDSARDTLRFVSAEYAMQTLPVRQLDLSDYAHRFLLKLAVDGEWLLGRKSSGNDLKTLYKRYLNLLLGRGLATCTGSIHVTELIYEFSTFCPPNLLKLLHCDFTGTDQRKTNWLLRLVRPPQNAQHFIYHLLLTQFLGCTVEEFFQLSEELSFFGQGPWPCLNPVAEHFREPVIPEYKLSSRLRDGRPTASFSCGCGFAYARSGPDTQPEHNFRIGRMISFGPVWETKMKQLWKDSSLSLSEVGRQLRVNPLTVRRHAARLKLRASRSDRRSKPLNRSTWLKSVHGATVQAEKRRTCRAKWISEMRQSPRTTLKALRRKRSREYAWLLKNDAEWLKRPSPYSLKRDQRSSDVDWQKRDAEYAVAVRIVATSLKHNPSRPVQVTRSAIGRAVGAVTLLRQKLHKLPLTAQVISNVVETRVEYAVRRVRWAAENFMRDHIQPRPWQLVLKANVYSLRKEPEVKSAINAAVGLIESNSSLQQKLTA